MSDSIYLHGSEAVGTAGRHMQAAAEEISRAATMIEDALQRHISSLNDFLAELRTLLETK